jgi:hypothetical protein
MRSRPIYAILGLIVGAIVNLLINLIADGIQQRTFANQFNDQAIWGLIGLALLGLLVGYWIGGSVQLSIQPQPMSNDKPDIVTLTRFRALLSYGKLKGKGIHLSDILLIGSRIDIET